MNTELYLLEHKQRELEYLSEFRLYGNHTPAAPFLNKLNVVVTPSILPGTSLQEFGAELEPPAGAQDDGNTGDDKKRLRSITAQYITELYLHWVSQTREKESEAYLKTLSGERSEISFNARFVHSPSMLRRLTLPRLDIPSAEEGHSREVERRAT